MTEHQDPHLRQVQRPQLAPEVSEDGSGFGLSHRILPENAKKDSFISSKGPHSALHWGQRKLMLSEVEFLTLYGHLANIIVYAGAAGGFHIPYLSVMFPRHIFHLYDPAEFGISQSDRIKIHNENMTDAIAARYSPKSIGEPVLYICDIRTVDAPKLTGDEKQDRVINLGYAKDIFNDNAMQLSWAQQMEAKMSMVKYKLPYLPVDGKNYTMYPKGDMHLPIWGKPLTTEARFIFSDPHNLVKHFHTAHEERMFYWNTHNLLYYYPHQYTGDTLPEGIDHCYSCRAELYLLENYVKQTYNLGASDSNKAYLEAENTIIRSLVKNFSERISLEISRETSKHAKRTIKYTLQSLTDELMRTFDRAVRNK